MTGGGGFAKCSYYYTSLYTAHWGYSQPQLFGASIWGGFFESLKHAKQDLSIIEFENHV